MALKWLSNTAFFIATLPYIGALHHYTIGPITQLLQNQDDAALLRILLYKFRLRKEQELRFTQIAV